MKLTFSATLLATILTFDSASYAMPGNTTVIINKLLNDPNVNAILDDANSTGIAANDIVKIETIDRGSQPNIFESCRWRSRDASAVKVTYYLGKEIVFGRPLPTKVLYYGGSNQNYYMCK